MTVAHCAYLFDVENYRATIRSMLPHLVANDFSDLHTLAKQVSNDKPQIWSVLAQHRLFLEDFECEEPYFSFEAQVNFWMVIVMSAFWQPIATPVGYVRSMRAAMQLAGESEDIGIELTVGKTTCALLQPQFVVDPIKHRLDKRWPFWSYGHGGGWLDISDIDPLLSRLLLLNGFFSRIDLEVESSLDVQPVTAYQSAAQMLSAAQRSKQGLFLSIVD
jgi:hypothetical protein